MEITDLSVYGGVFKPTGRPECLNADRGSQQTLFVGGVLPLSSGSNSDPTQGCFSSSSYSLPGYTRSFVISTSHWKFQRPGMVVAAVRIAPAAPLPRPPYPLNHSRERGGAEIGLYPMMQFEGTSQ